jgi:hypothetical protein
MVVDGDLLLHLMEVGEVMVHFGDSRMNQDTQESIPKKI